jgi:hypothetical protein
MGVAHVFLRESLFAVRARVRERQKWCREEKCLVRGTKTMFANGEKLDLAAAKSMLPREKSCSFWSETKSLASVHVFVCGWLSEKKGRNMDKVARFYG